jgi:hypothetical protein
MHQQCFIDAANTHCTDNEALSLLSERVHCTGGDDDSSIFSDICVDDWTHDLCWGTLDTLDACSDRVALESGNIHRFPSDDDDFEPLSLSSWNFENLSAVAPYQSPARAMSERGLSSATNGFKSTTLPALNDRWADNLGQRLTKTWQSSQETRAALSRQLTSAGRHSFMVTPTPIVHDHFHSAAMSGSISNRSLCTSKRDSEGIKAVPTERPFNRPLAPANRASVDSCGTTKTSHTTLDSIHTPPSHSLLHDPCHPRYPHTVTIVTPRLTKSKKPVKWKSSVQSQQILHQIHTLSMQTKQSLLCESSAGSSQALCRKAVPDSTSGVVPQDHPNLRAFMRRSQHSRRGLAAWTPPHYQGCAISKDTTLYSKP